MAAGYAAHAQDASTILRNPAGMSLLSGSQFQGGLQLTYGSVEFSPTSSTTVSCGNGGNAIGASAGMAQNGWAVMHTIADRKHVNMRHNTPRR